MKTRDPPETVAVAREDVPCAMRKSLVATSSPPVVISEFGGGALAGRHGKTDERWTEEMQRAIYEANIRMFGRIEGLAGVNPWVLTDFRSPRRPLAGVQDDYNRKGLFSPDGREKLAAETIRRFYETK